MFNTSNSQQRTFFLSLFLGHFLTSLHIFDKITNLRLLSIQYFNFLCDCHSRDIQATGNKRKKTWAAEIASGSNLSRIECCLLEKRRNSKKKDARLER